MANFNPGTGQWESKSGASFDNRYQAQASDDRMAQSSGSGGGDFASGMLDALFKIFVLIPKLLGLAIGGLCGLLLKMGMVGKVLLTALAAFGALLIVTLMATPLLTTDNKVVGTVLSIVMLAVAVAVGWWFWTRHHAVIKKMPYSHFVALTTRCMMICFWGPIGASLFFVFLILANTVQKDPVGFLAWTGIALAVAIIYWILKTSAYDDMEFDEEQAEAAGDASSAVAAGSGVSYSAPVPTPVPAQGSRCSAGDIVWARWSEDGNLYMAGVAKKSDAGAEVVYYDGVREERENQDIFYFNEAQQEGLTPHGNWKNKGGFYPCEILELRKNSVLVQYTEDQVKEDLPYYGLVFMK